MHIIHSNFCNARKQEWGKLIIPARIKGKLELNTIPLGRKCSEHFS